MEQVHFPENTFLYVNQSYLTVQKIKKICYCNYNIIGQIVEASDPLQNIHGYELQERKVKMFRPKYNSETGGFLGLYETVGFMLVRGDAKEIFLNFGFDKEKSKVLYSHYRRKIPNTFCGTMFNHHKTMIGSEELDSDFSQLYILYPPLLTGLRRLINISKMPAWHLSILNKIS